MTRSGLRVPASIKPLLHRFRLEDVPALGLQRGAHEAADLALVLDQQSRWARGRSCESDRSRVQRGGSSGGGISGGVPSGSVKQKRAPPPGLSSRPDPAAVRLDDRAADREAEADARRRRLARAAREFLEDRFLLALGQSRPVDR